MPVTDPNLIRQAAAQFEPRRRPRFQNLQACRDVIIELREKGASCEAITELLTKYGVKTKELEKAKKRLEAKLEMLAATHKKDNTLSFEELGIDRLFVDEAHYFKNLLYVSRMTRIAGLPQTASERAFDMFLKVGISRP